MIAGVILLASSFALLGASPSLAADSATIKGRVTNGTTSKAVPNQKVMLQIMRAGSMVSTKSATTDASGGFAFAGLESGSTWSYAVGATYRNADYVFDAAKLKAGETKSVSLLVYDPTDSAAGLKINEWIVWVDRESGVAIQQDVRLSNTGKATYVGKAVIAEGKKGVVQLPLLNGAKNLQYLGRFMQCCTLVRGTTFYHTLPVTPGESQGTMRYNVASVKDMSFPVLLQTKAFSMIVPSDVKVISEQVKPGGQIQDRGITYNVYGAKDLAIGTVLKVSVDGLGRKSIPIAAIVLLVLAALAGGAVAFLKFRPRRRKTPQGAKNQGAKKVLPQKAAPVPERRPATVGIRQSAGRPGDSLPKPSVTSSPAYGETSLGQAELLLEELAVLDLAFERGFVSDAVYQQLRAVRKAELVELRSARPGKAEE
ncbi:MAG: carboxypeptidase-like regulatory domain-containing protein [Actinomycetota bacterium]